MAGSNRQIHRFLPGIAIVLALLINGTVRAQNFFLPVDALSRLRMERAGLPTQSGVHYSFKPVLRQNADVERVAGIGPDSAKYYYWITAKLFSEHLIELRKPDIKLNLDPVFDFSAGRQFTSALEEAHSLYTNTRGFSLSAKIGKIVYIHTDFRENQARYPEYINRFVDSLGVVPGSGRVKDFKSNAYDFSMANGYVGIEAASWLSLNFGHGKQFIGDGHRSLLLSDNAYNYPYAGYTVRFGKEQQFQYRYTIALMQNLDRLPLGDAPESIFKRKYVSYNYVSYKPFPALELGLYESVIWKAFHDTLGTVPFHYAALNPVPLINTAVTGWTGAEANPLVGLNVGWQPLEKLRVYGQVMFDDPDAGRRGYQAGVKVYRIFRYFDLRAEFNRVAESSYGAVDPLMGYTNINQPVAHTLGAGFQEVNGSIDFLYRNWYVNFDAVYAAFDPLGRDPLKSTGDAVINSVERVSFQRLNIAYVFNPRTNLQMYFSVANRLERSTFGSDNNQFWNVGIRTSLQNVYTDF